MDEQALFKRDRLATPLKNKSGQQHILFQDRNTILDHGEALLEDPTSGPTDIEGGPEFLHNWLEIEPPRSDIWSRVSQANILMQRKYHCSVRYQARSLENYTY